MAPDPQKARKPPPTALAVVLLVGGLVLGIAFLWWIAHLLGTDPPHPRR